MNTPSAEVQAGHVNRLEMVKAAARTRKLPRANKRFALKKGKKRSAEKESRRCQRSASFVLFPC